MLSQTGSPLLPNYDVTYGSRSTVQRYRPSSTTPLDLPRTNFSNSSNDIHSMASNRSLSSTPIPFHDKNMVNKIQHSLTRVSYDAPVAHPIYTQPQPTISNNVSYNPPPQMVKQSFTDPEPAWRDTLRSTGIKTYRAGYKTSKTQPIHSSEHYDEQPKSPKPKVVNLQYNTPIGLYSKETFSEELHKQVG